MDSLLDGLGTSPPRTVVSSHLSLISPMSDAGEWRTGRRVLEKRLNQDADPDD